MTLGNYTIGFFKTRQYKTANFGIAVWWVDSFYFEIMLFHLRFGFNVYKSKWSVEQ